MSIRIEQKSNPQSGLIRPTSASAQASSLARLNPMRLGWAFGATGVVFYFGCMLTMAVAPREKAVVFFNSLLHGINVEPILKTSVPVGEVMLGLITRLSLAGLQGC